MNIFNIFGISGAGMGAQRSRMSVVAGNMANAETHCRDVFNRPGNDFGQAFPRWRA